MSELGLTLANFTRPELARDEVKGYWMVTCAVWGNNPQSHLDPNATTYESEAHGTWEDRFGDSIDIGAFNYKYQSGGATDTGSVSGFIPESPVGNEFRIFAQNGTWSNTRSDFDFEFQREDGSTVAVFRARRDGSYRHGLWYGPSWGSLTKGPQSGNYPRTNGWFRVDQAGFEYEWDRANSSSGINLDFRFDIDMSEVAQINVPYMRSYMDYTSGSNRNTHGYLKQLGPWEGR